MRQQASGFAPGVNVNPMMVGPQINTGMHAAPRHGQGQLPYSGSTNQRSQTRKPQQQQQQPRPQQAQAQVQPNDLSNSTSAVPSPFATSIPTPTGSASMPAMNLHGITTAPNRGAGLATAPGSASAASTKTVPLAGIGSSSPQVAATAPNQFYPMTAAQQSHNRRPVPSNVMPYPIRKYLSNMAILRLHEIINLINVSTGRIDDFDYWQRFTNDLFTPYGIMRYSTKGGEETRQFEFTTPIIPLICQSLGSVGVVRLEMIPQQLRAQVLSNGTIFFDCPRCTTTFYYPDGSYMTNFSQIKGIFDSNLKLEWVEISTYTFVPGIEWSSLERLISSEPICHEIFKDLGQAHKKTTNSDELKKQGTGRKPEQQIPENFAAITKLRAQFGVFHNISSFGIQESFMRALQVNDVISYLKNLKVYQKVHNLQSPLSSLEAFVATSQAEKASF